jgi:hypothetical protein
VATRCETCTWGIQLHMFPLVQKAGYADERSDVGDRGEKNGV